MSIRITIDNRQSVAVVDDEGLRRSLLRMVALEEPASVDVTVLLVDDAEIRRLNRDYLAHDWATDVISFVDDEAPPLSGPPPRAKNRAISGELAISVETAGREAANRPGWSLQSELLLYAVHGLLHLCGYDDLTDAERPVMRDRERAWLAVFDLVPEGLDE